MARKLILVRHDSGPADDRVSTWARQHGFDPVHRRPFDGDLLGEPDGSVAGSVVYGGRYEAYETRKFPFLREEARWIEACMAQGTPLLGICLGAQQIAHTLGATVGPKPDGACEFGYYRVTPTEAGKTILPAPLYLAQAHYHTFGLPAGAELLASSALFQNQAFRYGPTTLAFQFHAEVTGEGFHRFQAISSFYDSPGAQSRAEQDALMNVHDGAQAAWFHGFLENFFVQRAEVC